MKYALSFALTLLLCASHALAFSPPVEQLAAQAITVSPQGTVSLDLKSADVRDVLTRLGKTGHVNVVMAEDVQGQVTLLMRNVRWDVAMRQVLMVKGLDLQKDGNVIFIAKASEVQRDRVEEFNRTWCTPETRLPADTFCKKMEP